MEYPEVEYEDDYLAQVTSTRTRTDTKYHWYTRKRTRCTHTCHTQHLSSPLKAQAASLPPPVPHKSPVAER